MSSPPSDNTPATGDLAFGTELADAHVRTILEAAADGILVFDARGRIRYVNHAAEAMFGAARADLFGAPIRRLVPSLFVDADQHPMLVPLADLAHRVAASAETHGVRADGRSFPLEIDISEVVVDSKVTYAGIARDITQRRRAASVQNALLAIADLATEGGDLDTFYASIHRVVSTIIDATNFFIALSAGGAARFSFVYRVDQGSTRYGIEPIELHGSLTQTVFESGRPLLLGREEYLERVALGSLQRFGEVPESWLGVPLAIPGQCIGVMAVQTYHAGSRFSPEDVQLMMFVSSQVARAIEHKRSEEARRRYLVQIEEAHNRIREDLAMAARIQKSRLPRDRPNIPGAQFDWVFDSCDAVAGDMFNVIRIDDDHVAVYVLDVSGHGVQAAFLSTTLSRVFSLGADGTEFLRHMEGPHKGRIKTPEEVACELNFRFPMNLEVHQFFTLVYGILTLSTRRFDYVSAGHAMPLLVSGGRVRPLDGPTGPAIGLIAKFPYEAASQQLAIGDTVVLFTDGVEEAKNPADEEFGEARIAAALTAASGRGIKATIQRLRADLNTFQAGRMQEDDVTVIGFEMVARE